jgi:cobalt-zinc-cadmium resistance protein CzcA
MVFEDNIDVYWARQQVAERLQKVQTEIQAFREQKDKNNQTQ